MSKMQQMLLALLACLCFTTVIAQVNINVEIRGLEQRLKDNVRLFLSIEQQKTHALMSEGRLHRLHKKAQLEITKALQPFGYYRPVIQTELTQIAPGQWQATYSVDPGPAIRVGEFNFKTSDEINQDTEFQQLIQKFSLHKGSVFNHREYENIKSSLAKLAAERGYFKARFNEHRIEIDLVAYEVRIHLNYEAGPRYRFGEVFLNQDVLEPDLIRRYIPFEKGAPYTLNEVLDLKQALNDSDYFQTVEVSPAPPPVDSNQIPIDVELTPRKPHRYTLGLGYGTDTGARTRLGWEMPRFNKSGHRVSSEAKVSEIGYSLGAQYRVPVLNPRTDQMIYSAGVVNEKTDVSDSTVRTIGASLNHNNGPWRESVSINYQQEEYIIADDHGMSTLLIPGVNWSRIWGNNFLYILDGLRFDFGIRGATSKLISDTDFIQFQGGIKAINPLGSHDRIILNGRLGSTWTDDFHLLPSSVRFFAGGSQSVRGYAYQSLGPKDDSGKVIGGKHLMIGTIEFEHRFNGKLGVAVFYDGGNAIDNLAEKLERGAGIGLRWNSPVGPVRIDLASAVSRDDHPLRIHITIGPDL